MSKLEFKKVSIFLGAGFLSLAFLGLSGCKKQAEQVEQIETKQDVVVQNQQTQNTQKQEQEQKSEVEQFASGVEQIIKEEQTRLNRIEKIKSTWIFLDAQGERVVVKLPTKSTNSDKTAKSGTNKEIAEIFFGDTNKISLEKTKTNGNNVIYTDMSNKANKIRIANSTMDLEIADLAQPLVLLSPLSYDFSDGKSEYKITYAEEGKKRMALIQTPTGEELLLEQTEAWAKGAIYANDTTKLETTGKNSATLNLNNQTIKIFKSTKK